MSASWPDAWSTLRKVAGRKTLPLASVLASILPKKRIRTLLIRIRWQR